MYKTCVKQLEAVHNSLNLLLLTYHLHTDDNCLRQRCLPFGSVNKSVRMCASIFSLFSIFTSVNALQKIEIHARREDEAKYYSNLDVRQRVHVQVSASEMMPFNKNEIDSSPLG